jgi:cell division protein FtsB
MMISDGDKQADEWRRQFDRLLEERDALRAQLHQIRKQQAALAEKAARLRLQIALRDKSRFDSGDADWS